MLKFGIISDVKKGFAKVAFLEDDLVTDWWPVLVKKSLTDKESWPLEVNEHVACISDENCENGVILGAIYSETDAPDTGEGAGKFRKKFSDGTLIEYDKAAHKLTADVKGSLKAITTGAAEIEGNEVKAKGTVKIEATAPVINLTGNVVVSGSLVAASIATSGGGAITSSGDISTSGTITGAQIIEGSVRLGTHVHPGVQTGAGSTGGPV